MRWGWESGKRRARGNRRSGGHGNASTSIALWESNPLKAVAERVENSSDARAKSIVITSGREKGQNNLRVKDDGDGVRRNGDGETDFHYVATHVCDSIKRRLKTQGTRGLQGEFGIGLLSFWTLGEDLLLTSAGDDGRAWQMHLRKGDPSYRITQRPAPFPEPGTACFIRGVLPGTRTFRRQKVRVEPGPDLARPHPPPRRPHRPPGSRGRCCGRASSPRPGAWDEGGSMRSA